MVICDGVFASAPAVSHAELCAAIDAGWEVWGVSSIGAIRAHEMRSIGMRGYGWVYDQFSRYLDFTDDELCLLHLPEAPYLSLTEPLVNVRYALEKRGAALGMDDCAQRLVIERLRELWFGDRDHERIRAIMVGPARIPGAVADELLAWIEAHRIKNRDLLDLLTRHPWSN